VIEGRYQVIFVGPYNVGKSALVNAFLTEEYLPTVLEECTTQVTHVRRSEGYRVELASIRPRRKTTERHV